MAGRKAGGLRIDGLRLIIVAVSAVGLFTTYSALEIYRFGDLSQSLREGIQASLARSDALAALGDAIASGQDVDAAAAALAALPTAGATGLESIAPALEDWRGGAAPPLPLIRGLGRDEAARRDSLVQLWDEASQSLSQSLSLSLGSIVVLLFTVVLRSLAYLSARDRTEGQLRRARAAAEAANVAKSDFLATMSHEIRTPLTAIKGYAEMLDRSALGAAQRDHLGKLRDAGGVLGGLIDDILDLSKIEAGRIMLHEEAVDLGALAERVIALVRPTAQAKGLRIACTVAADVPRHVLADGARLLQVVLNLTNNAVKFTTKGEVALVVSRQEQALVIEVRDTGIGIAEADKGLLFKRFSQIDSSLTRAHAGSGLGLAISQGLVQRMGGTISVESVTGQGSTFSVTLPLHEADAPDTVPDQATQGAAPVARVGARVLIVEDSAQNQDLIRAVLTAAGYDCTSAMDGVEGLGAARTGGFDLVIMDMQMPRMDGIRATAAIRALPAPDGTVPILALSANALPEQVAAMAQAGAGRHLAKPFALDALTAAVAEMLGGGTFGEATAAPPKAAHDAEALDALAALLGADWVRARLTAVLGDLAWIADETDLPALRKRTHRLISEAGQLGFPAMAEAAHRLEEAIDAGAGVDPARAELSVRANDAAARLPALVARFAPV